MTRQVALDEWMQFALFVVGALLTSGIVWAAWPICVC
jgi:hypothetical protein